MARPIHFLGVFLLFAAFALLLIATISAPVINTVGLLRVHRADNTNVYFGTFGFCNGNACSGTSIGYQIANIMSGIDHTTFSSAGATTANGLTHAMILHPICAAFALIAFLLSLLGAFGSVFAALMAFVGWVLTLVVMAIDFSLFGIIKNHVNGDGSGSHAVYSDAMWFVLAAMIALFFGGIFVLLTCLGHRRQRRTYGGTTANAPMAETTTTRRRRRFW